MKKVVYGEAVAPLCGMCGMEDETVAHIALRRSKLASKESKNLRHDYLVKEANSLEAGQTVGA